MPCECGHEIRDHDWTLTPGEKEPCQRCDCKNYKEMCNHDVRIHQQQKLIYITNRSFPLCMTEPRPHEVDQIETQKLPPEIKCKKCGKQWIDFEILQENLNERHGPEIILSTPKVKLTDINKKEEIFNPKNGKIDFLLETI